MHVLSPFIFKNETEFVQLNYDVTRNVFLIFHLLIFTITFNESSGMKFHLNYCPKWKE